MSSNYEYHPSKTHRYFIADHKINGRIVRYAPRTP